MFVVGDETKEHKKIPWVTFSLLFVNLVVFCVQGFLGPAFTNGLALVPEEITTRRDLTGPQQTQVKYESARYTDRKGRTKSHFSKVDVTVYHYPGPMPIYLTLLTSMFLHGGLMHLIGNLWFLAVFGRSVEYALSPGRFLLYYIICGLAGGIAQTISDPHSMLPCIGASGAISGVMGGYLAIHPMQRLNIWVIGGVIRVPALLILGFWFAGQYASAGFAMEHGVNVGTAYMDHVGGFVTGLFLCWGTIMASNFKEAAKKVTEANIDPVAGIVLTKELPALQTARFFSQEEYAKLNGPAPAAEAGQVRALIPLLVGITLAVAVGVAGTLAFSMMVR